MWVDPVPETQFNIEHTREFIKECKDLLDWGDHGPDSLDIYDMPRFEYVLKEWLDKHNMDLIRRNV